MCSSRMVRRTDASRCRQQPVNAIIAGSARTPSGTWGMLITTFSGIGQTDVERPFGAPRGSWRAQSTCAEAAARECRERLRRARAQRQWHFHSMTTLLSTANLAGLGHKRASVKLGRAQGSRCRQQPMSAMSAGGARTPGGSMGRCGAYVAVATVCAHVSSPCSRLPYAIRCSSAPNAYTADACGTRG